jgi:hypothetical protein
LQGGTLKRFDGDTNLGERGVGVVENALSKLLAEQRRVAGRCNLVHHSTAVGVVHFQRVEQRPQRLLGHGIGPAVPEEATDSLGFTVHRVE